jgi:hypothetical protein
MRSLELHFQFGEPNSLRRRNIRTSVSNNPRGEARRAIAARFSFQRCALLALYPKPLALIDFASPAALSMLDSESSSFERDFYRQSSSTFAESDTMCELWSHTFRT